MTRSAISTISDDAWTPFECTLTICDEETQRWISASELMFTAFASQKKAYHVTGRVIVCRLPGPRPQKAPAQRHLFDVWRFPRFRHYRLHVTLHYCGR